MIRILLLLTTILSAGLSAQSYDLSLGLRIGTDLGVTVQARLPHVHKNFVMEGIIQSSLVKDAGSVTLIGKQHQPLLSRRLNLFYGAGLHLGWTDELNKDGEPAKTPLGIDGIVGAEATFARWNISYDFKPAINIRGGDQILDAQTAISIRYVLAGRNDIWNKKDERSRNKDRKKRQRSKRKARRKKDGKRWYDF